MTFLHSIYDSIYFNYLSFGTLLSFIFTILLGIYLITLPGKSKSTFHLGLGFVFMGLFNLSYVFAAMIYQPFAAFHRWGSVGFILPGILHIIQWIFYFPEDSFTKVRKTFQYTQWIIAIIVEIIFIYVSLHSNTKFHFTGHYWDFDAEWVSKVVGIVIFGYILLVPAVGIWKTVVVKTHERWAILQITIAIMVAAIVPAFMNILSRDGILDRGIFLTSYVLFTVFGFFFVVIIFINETNDRTTFMAKIVGVTLVTFLLLMQGMSFASMQDKEVEYDNIRIENIHRYLEGGTKHADMQYILDLRQENPEVQKTDYEDIDNLDLALIQQDFKNSLVYEQIKELPVENFQTSLATLLSTTHEEFSGYKNSILEFVEANKGLSNEDLKANLFPYFEKLNKLAFIATTKIGNFADKDFCSETTKYLKNNKDLIQFRDVIFVHLQDCNWNRSYLEPAKLKREINKYLRYFKPAMTRHYRKSIDGSKHYVAYIHYNSAKKSITEIGFSYIAYRKYLHPAAKSQIIILFIVLVIILGVFPLFFKGSLINPLMSLLRGVAKVNSGNLDVVVKVKVQDEIGFLSQSFNSMVDSIKQARKELQDYADNLEEKVKERTKEVQEKMEEVQKLKIQQDGDYFLTSLLAKPLFFNANKSKYVTTDFIIHQKKRFEFRNKVADLGGDICITGNLKFGTPEKFKRYTMAMNGDAMGKSMQGAGGSLVMGVVMNSIMARSAANKRILELTPEQWLTDVYHEVNSVFKSFNGTMVISATVLLIDDESGEMLYWNAEHPFTILYRDEKANFIEDGLRLRKLGLDSEYEFAVYKFQLVPGDIVILASDGRDDIDLTPNEPVRTINDDETMILSVVDEAKCSILEIERILQTRGDLTDDLSILRIDYKINMPAEEAQSPMSLTPSFEEKEISNQINVNEIYSQSKKLYQAGEIEKALELLANAYTVEQNNQKLNKLLGLLSLKGKDYDTAVRVLSQYLSQDPDTDEIWYYLSIAQKKMGNYLSSLEAAKKVYELQPNNISNLVNLSDLYRLNGNYIEAKIFSEKVLVLDSENKNAKKILNVLNSMNN
ncbi:MAG TPA: SpoIIE family protein phosphatase [Leptospiraceae bacterium]|nr:SpoIIE family protein phosphatase [Leptospiraceae bacterium]HMW04029.1 SpoIIE family protein phosphatase [Leptospiraceae bacterium]HMX30919.1 SpoIIE family protein phosphatase [Leptospiraceae bacterium]HMY30023.1 SpoIIE family protein phosphatase [Leptospiraceae bacterium]HMZ62790.1 SpoIIE family protein phosphatase [Leptospiraceae bacterium]